MRNSLHLAAALGGLLLFAADASAHSLKDLERMLGSRERYVQPLNTAPPAFQLRDYDGRRVGLADLRGKVLVVHFIYASCPDVCPLHASRIAEVQAMVNQTPTRSRVRFVTITTDPANDTPGVMRAFGRTRGLKPTNWAFLTTWPGQPEDTTRKLAKAFGHTFLKTKDGYQVHGVITHVIDKQGRWRANFHGLRFHPTNLVLFIKALVNDEAAPHDHGGKAAD